MVSNNSKIAVINYGIGNVRSLYNSIRKLDFDANVLSDPKDLKNYDKFFLPGVGSFGAAMKLLVKFGWDIEIKENVINRSKFIFGICLGMQLLLSSSEEHGKNEGLNLIPGGVIHLKKQGCTRPTPHIGWNEVNVKKTSQYFDKIPNYSDFYFVNSYVAYPHNDENILATTNYEIEFTSVIFNKNILGTQFHPEKSSKAGRQLLLNFLNA